MIIYVIIIVALFVAYATSSNIGSPDKMWELLTEVSKKHPSAGYEGSYLTFKNRAAIMTAWSQIMSGFASVFADPSYGQKAIAARPLSTVSGYVIGSLCWFIIPWALGTAAALSALALTENPVSWTYPNVISTEEVNMGMPMLYGLYALMGKSGAAAGLLILFMSCTSALSAELVSFSSVVTYDVYRTYINPNASGKQLVTVSHSVVVLFAIFTGGFTIMFNYIGITISWILTFIGIILGAAPVGIILTLFWKKMSKYCFYVGMPLGSLTGLGCWLGSAYHFYGAVDKTTLGLVDATIIANFVTFFSTLIYCIIITLIFPGHNSLDNMQSKFKIGDDATLAEQKYMQLDAETQAQLHTALKWAYFLVPFIFIGLTFILPIPMYGREYIMSKPFFRGWIVIIFIWIFLAFFYITFYPLYESREALFHLFKKMTGKEKPADVVFLDGHHSQPGEKEKLQDKTEETPSSQSLNGDISA